MLDRDKILNIIFTAENSSSRLEKIRSIGALEGILLDRGILSVGQKVPNETRPHFKRNWLNKPTDKVVHCKLLYEEWILEMSKELIKKEKT